jgi:hypothetical protein
MALRFGRGSGLKKVWFVSVYSVLWLCSVVSDCKATRDYTDNTRNL